MENEIPTFESYFVPTYYGSSLFAGFKNERGKLFNIFCKYIWYCTLMSIFLLTFTIYQDIYGERDREDALKQVVFVGLTLICVAKFHNGTKWRAEYVTIQRSITNDFSKIKSLSTFERTIVHKYAKKAKVLQFFWGTLVLILLFLFTLMGVGPMFATWFLSGDVIKIMLIEFYIPFIDQDKYKFPFYEIMWLYTLIQGCGLVAMFFGFDCFFLIGVTHACGKLELIKYKLRNLFLNDAEYDKSARDKLRLIIEEHQQVYSLCDKLNLISRQHNMVSFLLNSLEITSSGYQVIKGMENGVVYPEFCFFFVSAFFHIFLPCYCCAFLTQKSLEVSDAAYDSGWEHSLDRGLRAPLVVLMLRAQRPIVMDTPVGPVDWQMFSTVVRTAWSYFTLMSNSN